VEGVDGFDAAGNLKVKLFFFEETGDFGLDLLEGAGGLFVGLGDEVFKVFEALGVNVGEGEVGKLDAEATHVEAVGEGCENLEGLEGDFFLLVGRESREGAGVVEAVGELDDEDADVVAGGNHEAEEVVFCLGEVGVEVVHVFTDFAELGDAIDEEGDRVAELAFDVVELEAGVFDGVVEDAGDDGVFVHLPFFENLFDGERVDDVRLAGEAGLASVSFGREGDGALDAGGVRGFFILGHYVIIITYDKSFVDRW